MNPLSLLKSAEQSGERRQDIRLPLERRCAVFAIAANPGLRWTGSIVNVSSRGFGLCLDRRFEKGCALSVEWHGLGRPDSRHIICRVTRVLKGPNKRWIHGCEIFGQLEEEDLPFVPGITPARHKRKRGSDPDMTHLGRTKDSAMADHISRRLSRSVDALHRR